jgi:hypothetical protein
VSRANEGGGDFSREEQYFAYHTPGEGWFLIAGKPFEGAVPGRIKGNQIEFSLEGRTYSLVTGAPILYGEASIWVMHYSEFRFIQEFPWTAQAPETEPDITFGDLTHLTETMLRMKETGGREV